MPIQPTPVGPKSLLSSGACILLSVADSRTCRIGVAVICSRMTEFPALKISFHSIRRNPAVQDSSLRRSVLLALLLPLPHILSGQIEKPQPIGCVGFASRAAGGLARCTQEESSTHSRARVPQILRRLQKTYYLSTSRQAVGHVVTPKYVDISYRSLNAPMRIVPQPLPPNAKFAAGLHLTLHTNSYEVLSRIWRLAPKRGKDRRQKE